MLKRKLGNKQLAVILAVATLIFVGVLLRLHNSSIYLFYPDSYQNLMVANNIRDNRSLVGPLGADGVLYPDFFGWTRPVYASLIAVSSLFVTDTVLGARAIALIAGILCIPASYLLAWRYTRRLLPSTLAALLVTICSSLVIWGGFVLTESLGVLMLLILLERFFNSLNKPSNIGSWSDITVGIMFSLAVLTRYEYVLIMVPMIILIINRSRNRAWKITNIFIPSFLLIGFTFLYLSSPYSASSLWAQLQDLFYIASGTSLVCLVAYASRKYWLNLKLPRISNYYYLLIALVITGAAVLIYDGLRRFVINDFLIAILAFVGFRLMFGLKRHKPAGLLLLVSAVLLGAVYYRINPGMERYQTHLLPFLIIPAALAGECIARKLTKFYQNQFSRALILLLITIIGLQVN
jgi:hypothetical protein